MRTSLNSMGTLMGGKSDNNNTSMAKPAIFVDQTSIADDNKSFPSITNNNGEEQLVLIKSNRSLYEEKSKFNLFTDKKNVLKT